MAEQVGHNVVNYSESTGESLVDVAANQTIVPAAHYGSDYFPETKNDTLHAAYAANQDAIQANQLHSSMHSDIQPTSEAEPSAGDAAGDVTEADIHPDVLALDHKSPEYAQLVNGIHDAAGLEDGAADDGSVREGSVDVSVNSDTEGSRGDASELKRDEKHHVRSNSVKKPTTFSKVSVTKNFLAKSATATPPVLKTGDKPSPAGTPPQPSAAKPRLIAKTGTALRDVQRAKLGPESATGPDASKVWNKNRPVPPPPPRQFTDEELKQQYGIHLATRLQTDENGKESKWADIDDDEEDWAPDAVVWMDGTKSTLAPSEAITLMQKDQKPASMQPARPGESMKPTQATKRPTELGPTKTILKPGASAAAIQARQSDSGAATPTDKTSLTTDSSAALPSKSPWAVLPPVDKVPPINPPVQQKQQVPFSSQDARAYEPSLPPPLAREIAADTFDRSWREGEGGTRELFNSANGRYEPVQEGGRRGSIKPDSAPRKPAVLQRPSQSAAPAEPSAAFQTRSTSQMDGPWARRRGSSVSQGSIPPARRMSVSKTSEISPAPERRSSTIIGHDMRTSPKMARNEPAQPAMFSQQSAWQQQMPPRPESEDVEEEDPVKVQERVMKEKRELAKKRREEEEARLEAEKQERLKAKLASLGGAGKSRKEREAEAAAVAVTVQTPSSEIAPESALSALPPDQPQAQGAETSAEAALILEAQTLPIASEDVLAEQSTIGEILPTPLPPKDQSTSLPERPISSTDQSHREQRRAHLSPRANARAPFQQQQPGATFKPTTSSASYPSPGDRKQQPFGRSPLQSNDAFAPWGTTAPHGNVWGTSGIGNGTFEAANLFAPIPMSQQSSSLPPPPGMSRPPGSSRISPQSIGSESRSPNLNQQSVAEPSRGFGPPGLEARPDAWAGQGRVNGPSPAPGLGRQTHLPGPIAPPSRAQQQQQPAAQRQDALAAWNNAAHKLPQQYKSEAEAAEKQPREATINTPRDDTFKETFRQTSAEQGKLGAPRRYDKTEYTIHDAQGSRSVQSLSPVPPSAQTQPSGPFSTASPLPQDLRKMAGENTVRIPDPSLNPAHGGLPAQISPIGPPGSQPALASSSQNNANFAPGAMPPAQSAKDPSPPPPETLSHPVNSGDSKHPLVKLPPEKPKVKLPPALAPAPAQAPQHTPAVLPPRPIQNWGAPGSSRPIVMQEAWQARFNGLFNRTPIQTETPPSPPKTPPKAQGPALAVTSSSRAVMDDGPAAIGATVSLPQVKKATSPEGFTIDDSEDVISKPIIEQMFKEELSFGSLPKVSIPRNPVYDAFFDPLDHNLLKLSTNSKDVPSIIDAQSEPEFNPTDVQPRRRDGYYVHLPGTKLLKKFVHHKNGNRKPSGTHQERKSSGKFKGKGKEAIPNAPVATGTSNPESRKTSFQKTQSPAPALESTPSASSPANDTSRKTSWAKPPKGRGRGPAPVKAAQTAA